MTIDRWVLCYDLWLAVDRKCTDAFARKLTMAQKVKRMKPSSKTVSRWASKGHWSWAQWGESYCRFSMRFIEFGMESAWEWTDLMMGRNPII